VLVTWQGNEAAARARLTEGVVDATARGEGRALSQTGFLTAILCNGLGRYDEALTAALAASNHDDLGVAGLVLVELVEAAARSGRPEVARDAVRALEHRVSAVPTDWGMGVLARSRALVAEASDAEAHYVEAIARLERTRIVVHLARAHLVYGEWLRRADRRRDARTQLRVACELFDRIGVGAYAERARRELRAAGDAAPPRSEARAGGLTPQETQIAELAASGRTNPEIGRELFISARTVEYHIAKIFTKLGISSRRELAVRLVTNRATSPSPGSGVGPMR
jgi:DNA-binding CsgD family transcriptional regulator